MRPALTDDDVKSLEGVEGCPNGGEGVGEDVNDREEKVNEDLRSDEDMFPVGTQIQYHILTDDSTYILRLRGGTEFEHISFARSAPARRIHRVRSLNKRMGPLHIDPSVPPRYFGSPFPSFPRT